MNFRISDRAAEDLLNIADFLSTSSFPAAARFLDRFEATCARIKQFPRIGHRHAWLPRHEVLVVDISPWVLVYDVSGDSIRVLRVVHGSADFPSLPLE